MEIERIFLIPDLEVLRKKLIDLGFILRNAEGQYAEYVDYPDFRFKNTRQDFRIRYVYAPDQCDGEVVAFRVFKGGEVSFSSRDYPDGYSEVRDQIKIVTPSYEVIDTTKRIILKMGMIVSFTLWKDREEYSRSMEENFRNELHIEVDRNIRITRYPHHSKYILQDTLQICKETEGEKEAPEIVALMKELGLTNQDVVTKNYNERLLLINGEGEI